MSQENRKRSNLRLVDDPPAPALATGSGGDGGGTDARLAMVESRLSILETELKHLATKEDIEKMKVGMLKWIIGPLGSGLAIVTYVLLKILGGSGSN